MNRTLSLIGIFFIIAIIIISFVSSYKDAYKKGYEAGFAYGATTTEAYSNGDLTAYEKGKMTEFLKLTDPKKYIIKKI